MTRLQQNTSQKTLQVLVVGCGNIGSRLLQSLAKVSPQVCAELSIHGLEPFEAARSVSRDRFNDVNVNGHTLSLHSDVTQVPTEIDLLVVAVDARNRLGALSSVLAHANVKYAVLEKTLFVCQSEFKQARDLLTSGNVTTWVNCSRNVWPGYEWLKSEVEKHGPVTQFSVTGSDWNMASNAIHFLAVLEFVTGSKVRDLALVSETVEVREAKRPGYREVVGVMRGCLGETTRFELSSLHTEGHPVDVKVEIGDRSYAIAEGPQSVIINPEGEQLSFGMLHASELSQMFEMILTDGTCRLPVYDDSAELHMKLFSALEKSIGEIEEGELVLPIT